MQTVASRISDVLAQVGVNVHYVPGGSLDPFLGALAQNSRISIFGATNESAAACAALGDSFRTGIGIAVVTQGAGLAALDNLPWLSQTNGGPCVLFVGQAPEEQAGTDAAFQSVDAIKLSGYAKKIYRIGKDDNAAQIVCDAITIAQSSAPGAVVIELPIDVQTSHDSDNEFVLKPRPPIVPSKQDRENIFRIKKHIERATPLFILGDVFRTESIREPNLRQKLAQLCDKTGAAVGTTHGALAQWPTNSQYSIGTIGFNIIESQIEVFAQFDFPILLGAKPDANLTKRNLGYEWTKRPFVMVYPDKGLLAEHQQRYPNMIGIYSDVLPVLELLASYEYTVKLQDRYILISNAHKQMLAGMTTSRFIHGAGGADMRQVASALLHARGEVPIKHFFDGGDAPTDMLYRIPSECDDQFATASAHLGFALSAGISAASEIKDRSDDTVIFVHTGDGGMNYAPAQFAKAAERQVPLVVAVYNDSSFRSVERDMVAEGYPSAHQVAGLPDIDFATVAEGYGGRYGAKGYNVSNLRELPDAFSKAIANAQTGHPTLLDIQLPR